MKATRVTTRQGVTDSFVCKSKAPGIRNDRLPCPGNQCGQSRRRRKGQLFLSKVKVPNKQWVRGDGMKEARGEEAKGKWSEKSILSSFSVAVLDSIGISSGDESEVSLS